MYIMITAEVAMANDYVTDVSNRFTSPFVPMKGHLKDWDHNYMGAIIAGEDGNEYIYRPETDVKYTELVYAINVDPHKEVSFYPITRGSNNERFARLVPQD
jgi:hypothetical protein